MREAGSVSTGECRQGDRYLHAGPAAPGSQSWPLQLTLSSSAAGTQQHQRMVQSFYVGQTSYIILQHSTVLSSPRS